MNRSDRRWFAWGRSLFAAAVVALLVALGVANIALYSRWHEVEDGVLWSTRAEGVTAIEVAPGSAAASVGIERGDVLLAVNGEPIQTRAEVVEFQHRSHPGTRLAYMLLRLGSRQALQVSLAPAPHGSSMYFVLAAVGLFTLLVGASVRLRRPDDQATLHFFWLCVAFFGVFTFSFSGPFDRLDWVFYWGDAIAFALLPPLLLHFALEFPERPESRTPSAGLVALMYLPAFALAAARIVTVARGSDGSLSGPLFSRAIELLDRAEPIYLFVCAAAALAALVRAFQEITSVTGRRQLRWIAWGTALGVGPFAFGYALPWAFGADPPLALQLTAIPLGLVPLTFACAIVRYRLRDVEVIIKRALAYTAFLGASAALYMALLKVTGFAFANDSDPHNWLVALLATAVIVLLARPVKESGAERAGSRVLPRPLRLPPRARRVRARPEQRSRRRAPEPAPGGAHRRNAGGRSHGADARAWRAGRGIGRLHGDWRLRVPARSPASVAALHDDVAPRRGTHRRARRSDRRRAVLLAEEVEFWRDAGIYYFVPCVFEGAPLPCSRSAGRKPTSPSTARTSPADRRGGAGGHGHRERPAVSGSCT